MPTSSESPETIQAGVRTKSSSARLVLLVLLILCLLAVPIIVFGERFEMMFDGERAWPSFERRAHGADWSVSA
jgi:hypothetical protein